MNENGVMIQEENSIANQFESAARGSQFYSSLPAETKKERAKVLSAINSAETEGLSDHVNQTLWIKDIIAHYVEQTNESTGEVEKVKRIVLIDKDGNHYACVAKGVASSLGKIMSLFGAPTWEPALPMIPKKVMAKKGKTLIIELDVDAIEE